MDTPDDICPKPPRPVVLPAAPHAPPMYLSSVYECRDPAQAEALLAGSMPGYVYARDGHPNADQLAEKCRLLHGTDRATITSTGMSALALVALSQLSPGDHVVVSNQLYGRTQALLGSDVARWGVDSTLVDPCDLAAVKKAMTRHTRLIVVETISNPLLRVANLAALAELARTGGADLLADNTFAGPIICRPHDLGATWIMESLTKSMNGHSDVVLGLLCGPEDRWQRVPGTLSTWGLASSPFDCWLALRGLGTLGVRMERASANALAAAEFLASVKGVDAVYYPGLANHPDHDLARRQFGEQFGSMVSFTLQGGLAAATQFMAAAADIPFCPSLGELSTTVSHPESTSHRGLLPAQRAALGITGGTLRLSVGIESADAILQALRRGVAGLG
jgi:cystathionine beta-lyase/cystathionine gamma-synthase